MRESMVASANGTMLVTGCDVNGALQGHSPLEAQLQATLNLVPAHAWYALPSGALTFVNRRSADYLGLPEDHPLRSGKVTGAGWDSHLPLLHPDDREETRRVWSDCLRAGRAGEVSFRVPNAEGKYRWFLSRAEPIRADANGTLLYWIGVNFDIEERKQAEFYLAEGQRIAHAGSWSFAAGGFEYWSSELFQIHGLDPTGNPPTTEEYFALVHPEDREFVRQEIQNMLITRRAFDFTKRIVRPDGKIRSVRCVGVPATQAGAFRGLVGTGMDVTEQEQLIEQLRKSEEELRQMLDFAPQLIGVYGPNRERLYLNHVALAYAGVSLEMPPLRARRADIPLLVEYFIDRYARKAGKNIRSVDKKTLQLLESYPWPGNIRELQNVIERSVIVCETGTFTVDESWLSQPPLDTGSGNTPFLSEKVAATERETIERALRESQGRIFGPSGAAAKLGIARSTLESKIRSLNIDKNRFKIRPGA
jgi:PAS domain S-box-containing protein